MGPLGTVPGASGDRYTRVGKWPCSRPTRRPSGPNTTCSSTDVRLVPETPVRSSLGLHMVALKLRAGRVRFTVTRSGGESDGETVGELYTIQAIIETPSTTEQDFTLWIHPWNPPVDNMMIQVLADENDRADDPSRPTGIVDVHLLSYGSRSPASSATSSLTMSLRSWMWWRFHWR